MKLLVVIYIMVVVSVGAIKNKKDKDCNVKVKNCEYKGQKFEIGESFEDDCNTCACYDDGKVACTLMLCQDNDSCASVDCAQGKLCWVNASGIAVCRNDPCMSVNCSDGKICAANRFDCTPECVISCCEYNRETYYHGESFPSKDGINQCSCSDGKVVCTMRACGGTNNTCEYESSTYNEGDSFPCVDGCNNCSCSSGNVTCTTNTCESTTCDYEGITYNEGDSFPCVDGCNNCSCSSGNVTCTAIPCNQTTTCDYEDIIYNEGDSFPCVDGCNNCSCSSGNVTCTAIPCNQTTTCQYQGSTYNEGDSFPCIDGCNNCSCSSGNVTCTNNTCVTLITCGTNTDCTPGFYCSKKSCNAPQGTCNLIPPTCVNDPISPVCGCDNQAYNCPCSAALAGISVKNTGNC